VLDFGGAYLGDQVVLSISELFESRAKLKSVKLMNNKISDEIFPDLLSRCRNLYSINLSYNNLTEKSLEWLEK
jgi:Ran GTPase-activating protein (RanGAP) involved in mRNA processing and transport